MYFKGHMRPAGRVFEIPDVEGKTEIERGKERRYKYVSVVLVRKREYKTFSSLVIFHQK